MRDQITHLRSLDEAVKAENNPSLDAVTAVLDEPLQWIFNDSQSTSSQELVRSPAWKHHLYVLLRHVVPDWIVVFGSHTSRQLALETTVLGYSKERPINNKSLTCAMAQTSLSVLLECIGTERGAPPEAISIYIHLLKRLTSQPLFGLYMHEPPMDIRYFCSVLCSIPARLANTFAFEQSVKEDWYYEKNYYANLSRSVCQEIIKSVEEESKLLQKQVNFVGELLAKIARQGYASKCVESIYPILIAQYHKQPKSIDTLSNLWFSIWTCVEKTAGPDKILAAALQYTAGQLNNIEHRNLSPQIKRKAVDLSNFLFGTSVTSEKRQRVDQFLSLALFKLSKSLSSTVTSMRIAITAALHALGIQKLDGDERYSLSAAAENMIYTFSKNLCNHWIEPFFISHCSYYEQQNITAGLLLCIAYLSKDRLQELISVTPIFQGIQLWLDSGDASSAKIGVSVAESMSFIVDEEEKRLNTGFLDPDTDEQYFELKKLIQIQDALVEATLPDGESEPVVEEVETSEDEEEEKPLDPDMVINVEELGSDSDSEDSDLEPYPMEDESDPEDSKYGDGSKPRKKRLKEPVYVLDLMSYLKDREDPVKLELALNAAENLIRRKTGVGYDLEEAAIPLADSLISFDNSYDIKDADQRRQNALAALMVAVPRTVTGHIIDSFYDRNTPTGTKQLILSSIIFAVRELAGIEERKEEMEPTQDVPSTEFEKLSIEPQQQQRVGKVRVFSRQMEIERKRREQMRSNKLSGLAGPVFFFPLLVGWWEGAQGLLKRWMAQDNMLAERFIMTLNVIMQCSTNIPDKRRIVKEYFEFALPLRYAKLPRPTIRAVLLGFNVALNVCYKGQETILLDDYMHELTALKSWLDEIMELVGEDDLKHLAIGLLMRLVDISKLSR